MGKDICKQGTEMSINPDAPDNHWVSPSGSDCWLTVSRLKQLIAAVERLQTEHAACHAELVAIHAITMCIAECPPHQEGDTLTVKGVKNIVDVANIAEQQLQALRTEVERLQANERDRCIAIVQKMVLAGRVADAVAAKIRSGESV